MGDYAIEYFNELFKKTYAQALQAKNLGNLPVAKKKLYDAAALLKNIAAKSPVSEREVLLQRSERIHAIADSIEVEKAKPIRPGAAPSYSDASSPASPTSYGSSESQAVEANDDGIEGFVEFYSPDDLVGGFDTVIGLEEAKDAVTEYIINPIRYADSYNYNFNNNKAVLLEGPPGTGKTTFAKAVAKEIQQPFALVNVANLVNAYIGETAKNIDKVFAALRAYAEKNDCGLTVFFDEIDEIAKKRTSDDKTAASAVPALLRNMDGVKENKRFLILANTNCVELLDEGVRDRFRKKIHIPLPDETMRLSFFQTKLKEIEPQYLETIDFPALAAMSEGLSGRQITYICDDFKYYMGGVKAGLKSGDNLTEVLASLIQKALETN